MAELAISSTGTTSLEFALPPRRDPSLPSFKDLLAAVGDPTATSAAGSPVAVAPAPATLTVVQRGDCLSKLCADALRAQGVSPSQQDIHAAVLVVAKANHLANANRIYAGQKLDLSVLGPQSASATAQDSTQPWRSLMAGTASLTSEFGLRPDPFTGKVKQHEGIDLAAPSGTPITAPVAGQVVHSGWKRGYGNAVVLRHENGVETVYGHLSKSLVKVGEQVSTQVPIAKVGSQGHSTGAHLHFEVRRDGKAVDPITFLQQESLPEPPVARVLAGFSGPSIARGTAAPAL